MARTANAAENAEKIPEPVAGQAPEAAAPGKKMVKPGKKMVKVKLFKDNHDYKDDVFVAVNGERYLIQRGVEVEVPDYIAEVLEHSAQQDARTAELIEKIEADYAE